MLKKLFYKLFDIVTLGRGVGRNFQGNHIRIPPRYYRYFPEDYEKDNFQFINEQVRRDMIIFDIGAHIGVTTVVLAQRAGKGGKVFSFEPTPTTAAVLKKTVAINKLGNVSVETCAISDKKGKATFHISENQVDNANSLSDNIRPERQKYSIDVELNTIDDLVKERNLPRIDFIKIDAEGAEARVLKGGDQTITKFKPRMTLGIHPIGIKNMGDSQVEIWDWLKQKGYKIIYEGKELPRDEFAAKTDLFDVVLV